MAKVDPARPPDWTKERLRQSMQDACKEIPCYKAEREAPVCIFCPHLRRDAKLTK